MQLMEKYTTHRPRWYQFNLASLLLFTALVAVWLAWELAYIRERQEWARNHADLIENEIIPSVHIPGLPPPPPEREVSIPWWRKLLGDEPVRLICEVDAWTDADRDNAVRLFPEADFARRVDPFGADFEYVSPVPHELLTNESKKP